MYSCLPNKNGPISLLDLVLHMQRQRGDWWQIYNVTKLSCDRQFSWSLRRPVLPRVCRAYRTLRKPLARNISQHYGDICIALVHQQVKYSRCIGDKSIRHGHGEWQRSPIRLHCQSCHSSTVAVVIMSRLHSQPLSFSSSFSVASIRTAEQISNFLQNKYDTIH